MGCVQWLQWIGQLSFSNRFYCELMAQQRNLLISPYDSILTVFHLVGIFRFFQGNELIQGAVTLAVQI